MVRHLDIASRGGYPARSTRQETTMDLDVSIVKNGQTLATERLTDPQDGEVTAAIGRVSAQARQAVGGTFWPAQIDVREV